MAETKDNIESMEVSLDEKKTIQADSEPIDNGEGLDSLYSWAVATCGMLNYLMVFGNFNAFGIFQEYYVNTMFTQESASAISWISTMSYTFTLSGGFFASIIISYIGIRKTTAFGWIVSCLGLLLASFSNKIWQLTLTQGFIFGFGSSILINCSIVIPSLWFDKYRNLAIAITSSGSGFGSLVVGPIVRKVIAQYGLHWSFRVLFFISFVVSGASVYFFKPRTTFTPSRNLVDLHLLKRPLTMFICAGGFFAEWGYIVLPLYFPSTIAEIGRSRVDASNAIIFFSAFSGISRLLSSVMASRIGPNMSLIYAMFGSAILIFSMWLPFKSFIVYFVFVGLYGITCPLFFPLTPVIISNNYEKKQLSQVNGLAFLFYGLSSLIGIPLMGFMVDKIGKRESYTSVKVLGGVVFIFAGIVMTAQYLYCRRYIPKLKTGKI
ncbi:hypothetical protein BB559_003455 [Furculomyces boomerangus]|uniref:Major facilitator superfamily (MFS) profile domain-containing protein n=1 Tax=Furculomyces boomerangus TaxID=61424 RepID=A0A2T9YL47_9FUNG|nr:hypothetical protein BB559_003455 [Furculomyces boomerangus]